MPSRSCFDPGSLKEEPNGRRRGQGCGFQAALGFRILIGLPVLFIFAFGNAPCPDGPCNPNGAANLRIAAITLVALALFIGGIVWWFVDSRDRRQPERGAGHHRQVERVAKLLLVVTAGFVVYVILG